MMNDPTEWNPNKLGDFGTLEVRRRRRLRPPRYVRILNFIIALIVILALLISLTWLSFNSGWSVGLGGFVLLVVYFLAALYVHLRPNEDRLAFTWTDRSFSSDVNQFLALLWLLLLPGRYVTESCFIFFMWKKLSSVDYLATKDQIDLSGSADLFR